MDRVAERLGGGLRMAVLVGLVIGIVAGYRRANVRFGIVLIIPMCVAALEIIVNAARFGVAAMAVWTPILLGLTIGATAAAVAGGRWLSGRRYLGAVPVPPPDE
jgi:hypothetical protein